MKILVTGGAGFIASHIVDAYVRDGHAVTIIDNLSTGRKENINPRVRFVHLDIRDEKVSSVFKEGSFDIVNHHAAQIDVRLSVQDPLNDASINVLGLISVLEHARHANVKKIIFSASGGTYYGECGKQPAQEEDQSFPMSPYGINKMISEYYIVYYAKTFGMKYTILRYGNVYGPRQHPHSEAGVVAIFCGRILENKGIDIFGDGKQQRDYIFVDDVVAVNRLVLSSGDNRVYNIGTGVAASVLDLAEQLKVISQREFSVIHRPPRTGELFRSVMDVSRAAEELSWKAAYPLREGLTKTYQYIIEHFNQGAVV